MFWFPCPTEVTTDAEKEAFNYEQFFEDQIAHKKADNTYREFRKVSRQATKFPLAREVRKDKEITVWCSNDYLGMSWHPRVQEAVV